MKQLKKLHFTYLICTFLLLNLWACNPLGKSSRDTSPNLCIGTSLNLDCDDSPDQNVSLTVEQGPSQVDPSNDPSIIFIATFSAPIDAATFTASDIFQLGTAAATWTVNDNGDATEFTLTATALSGGTIIPFVGQGAISTASGLSNESSTSIDNSVTFDSGVNPPSGLSHTSTSLNSNDTAPTSWTVSPDGDIANYQLAVGTTGVGAGQNDLVDWTDVGTGNSHPGFMGIVGMTECISYFTSIRAVDGAGNISSSVVSSNSFTVDFSAPSIVSMLSLSNTFAKTDLTPTFSWAASTDNCAFDQYEIAVGTGATGAAQSDIIAWTEIGNALSFVANSPTDATFTLQHGTDYFTSVRAKDVTGNTSAETTSSAWQLNYNYAKLSATDTTSGSNINQSAAALLWTADVMDTSVFDHNAGTAQNITLLQAGNYLAQVILPMETAVQRSNVRIDFFLDGTLVQGGRSDSSYIRNGSDHTEASDHAHFVIPGVTANQVLTVEVSQVAASGTVTITDQATLVLTKVDDTDPKAFNAFATETTAGTNFNTASATPLEWNRSGSDLFDATVFTHTTGSENITLNEAGDYLLYFNIPFNDPNGTQGNRASILAEIRVNGATVGFARQGYLRRSSGHNESSVHWAGVLRGINAADILTVELLRDTTVTQTVNISTGQSASLFIQKIETSEYADLSGLTVNNGSPAQTNLNQGGNLEWTTQNSINSSIFTHSTATDPQSITINSRGDYYIATNTVLSSTVQRANVELRVSVNGIAEPGIECKSNYIRSVDSHNNASCAMVTLLHDLQVGDIVRIATVAEGVSGTVTASSNNNILIWKRP